MNLFLHETRAGKKIRFEPLEPGVVRMYVCGPTVYSRAHIGNARPPVVFDVLARVLRTAFSKVRYAANITDIDDKINAAARANGEDIADYAERFAAIYREDISALNVLPPDIEPRATHHIEPILAMITQLVSSDRAYEADGHVLFDVASDPSYGLLSNRTLDEMIDGARVEIAPYKRDPKDFVLWKPSDLDLPGWESPWGRGRPGWHIECSAMIREHFGSTIDIHGGGSDLLFPHHENELAQGRGIDGADYVRYWVHNGMLTVEKDKMSKSVGNVSAIRDLLADHDGETLRYALLSGHHRQSLHWDLRLIHQARRSLDSLYGAVRHAQPDFSGSSLAFADRQWAEFPETVRRHLEDDLHTPRALATMHEIAGKIRRCDDKDQQRGLRDRLLAAGWLLGILQRSPEEYFQSGAKLSPEEIERLLECRDQHRQDREFHEADEIRTYLEHRGVQLEDSRSGTIWKRVRRRH